MDIGSGTGYPSATLSNFAPARLYDRRHRMRLNGRVLAIAKIREPRNATASLHPCRQGRKV